MLRHLPLSKLSSCITITISYQIVSLFVLNVVCIPMKIAGCYYIDDDALCSFECLAKGWTIGIPHPNGPQGLLLNMICSNTLFIIMCTKSGVRPYEKIAECQF